MIPTFLWLSLQPRWIASLQLRTKHSLLFGCCKLLKVDSTDYLLIPYTEIVTPYKFMLTWCPHWGNKLLQINFLPSLVPCFHRLLSFKIVMFINQRVIRFSGTLHSSPKKKGQCFLPQIPSLILFHRAKICNDWLHCHISLKTYDFWTCHTIKQANRLI